MATIITINVGSSDNDGTGSPLRTAFQNTNTNFQNVNADLATNVSSIATTNSNLATTNTNVSNLSSIAKKNIAIISSIPNYPTIGGIVTLASCTVPANTFKAVDGIAFEAQFNSQALMVGTPILSFYFNTVNSMTGATRFAYYQIPTGNFFTFCDRSAYLANGLMYITNATFGSASSSFNRIYPNSELTFNPAVTNYFFVQTNVQTTTDRLRLNFFKLTN